MPGQSGVQGMTMNTPTSRRTRYAKAFGDVKAWRG